jgi:hypothetical protein
MSASQAHALGAIAYQFASALEAYEAEVEVMLANPAAPDAYLRVSRRMDEMRMYSAALRPVAAAWVELMIRHFELTHGMWRLQQDGAAEVDLIALRQQLSEAALRLSRKCGQLMPQA